MVLVKVDVVVVVVVMVVTLENKNTIRKILLVGPYKWGIV